MALKDGTTLQIKINRKNKFPGGRNVPSEIVLEILSNPAIPSPARILLEIESNLIYSMLTSLLPDPLPLKQLHKRTASCSASKTYPSPHRNTMALKDRTTSKSIARTSSLGAGMSLLKSY